MTTQIKKAILTMGLPGAGKSHVLAKNYNVSDYTLIDPDLIKTEQPDYDPKDPQFYHEWSKVQAFERTAIAIENGENLIIDGTGTNVEKMYKQIKELQMENYVVELLYVKVKLSTSLERNFKRERTVPTYVIMEKFDTITYAHEILQNIADVCTVIKND